MNKHEKQRMGATSDAGRGGTHGRWFVAIFAILPVMLLLAGSGGTPPKLVAEILQILAALGLAIPFLAVVATDEERLSLSDAAKLAGVNTSTVWRWALKSV